MPKNHGKIYLSTAFFIFALYICACAKEEAIPGVNPGNQAPDFTLTSVEGKTVSLKDYQGIKSVYIVYWATWCPGCRNEIPYLKEAYQDFRTKDIEFFSINVGVNESRERIKLFKKKHAIPYPILFDEGGRVTKAYGVSGIPSHIIIDSNGLIVYRSHHLPKNISKFMKGHK